MFALFSFFLEVGERAEDACVRVLGSCDEVRWKGTEKETLCGCKGLWREEDECV